LVNSPKRGEKIASFLSRERNGVASPAANKPYKPM
jgi:hypothetical protein